jgi:hypothetical protein
MAFWTQGLSMHGGYTPVTRAKFAGNLIFQAGMAGGRSTFICSREQRVQLLGRRRRQDGKILLAPDLQGESCQV